MENTLYPSSQKLKDRPREILGQPFRRGQPLGHNFEKICLGWVIFWLY